MDLQAMSDKIEIHELLARYARGVDTQDWELWKTVFTPEAFIDYSSAGAAVGSRDEVALWLARGLDGVPMIQHVITNVEIELDGDRAKVRALFYNPMHLHGMANPSFCGGAYHHDMVRTPEGWKSERLVEEMLWFVNPPSKAAPSQDGSRTTGRDGTRAGIRIYRAADAPALTDTSFAPASDFGEHEALRSAVAQLAQAARPTFRLLVNQARDEGGFSVLYLAFQPNFPLFRHKHEDDCLYLIVSGSAVMGNQTLRAGDCFFVPAMAPYHYTAGPDGIEVLEVRHGLDPEVGFTTIYVNNPESRLDETRRAIAENTESWSHATTPPMLAANAAGG